MAFRIAHVFHSQASIGLFPNAVDVWYQCTQFQHLDPVPTPNNFHMPLGSQIFQQIFVHAPNHVQRQQRLCERRYLECQVH